MKLGAFLLIIGLLIAGFGAYMWQYYGPSFFGYRPEEAQHYYAVGIGCMVFGGGLAVGGIIRMVLKR